MFGEPGTYTAEFWAGGVRLTGIDLHVVERQPPPAVTGPRPN